MRGVLLVLIVTVGIAPSATAQDGGCEWLSGRDPVYAEAMDLMQTLVNRGVMVSCVGGPSTFSGMFEGELGAAIFWTSVGKFEVHLLGPEQTFDALIIHETTGRGGFRYSLRERRSRCV
jgi:hypothetical protein